MGGIYLSDTATTETDARVIIENGKGVYSQMTPNGRDSSQITLQYKCSPSKFLGRPNPLSEDDLRGNVGSNPTEQVYFHIWGAPNSSSDGSSIGLNVRLEYVAIFTEPNNLALS